MTAFGVKVIISPHAPVPVMLKFPKKGPYYMRRLKKLMLDKNNWSKPTVLFMGLDTVVIHPSLYHLLAEML